MFQFSEGLPFSLKMPGSIRSPQLKDEIHCAAVLVDATHVTSLKDGIQKKLMKKINLCGRKG